VRRTGIDLSSIRCNVVDAELSGRRRRGEATAFRVRNFASITHLDNTDTLTTELKALAARGSFPRRAWVNLWDVRSSHQYLLMPSGPESELESRVRRHGASVLGMSDLDVTVSMSIGGTRGEPGHHPKREVSFFAAGSDDIRVRLRPIVEAGFVVEGVTTPCGALWSQARLRRASLPGEVHAHVALGVSQSALGIFGDGNLLYARDLDWGYAPPSAETPPQDREMLAGRLAAELRRSFLYLKQYWEPEVSQVLLCGDMPEVRSLTAPLIERLNIEVETLDTLEGIDASSLPEGFAERASTLRLASSIAVEPPPVNLLPVEVTASRTSRSGRRIVAAGTAAAVGIGAFLYGQANVSRAAAEQQLDAVRREMAVLPARGASGSDPRAGAETERLRQAALRSLAMQGPVMARVLESVARAAPQGITLRSLRALPDGSHWNVSLDAFAAGDETVSRQIADHFLRALSEAPRFGEPIRQPARRFGPDGVEIAAVYRVRK
jgi:Tfp pilus assembly PilM family ATPase